jgi:hypothetical protein
MNKVFWVKSLPLKELEGLYRESLLEPIETKSKSWKPISNTEGRGVKLMKGFASVKMGDQMDTMLTIVAGNYISRHRSID